MAKRNRVRGRAEGRLPLRPGTELALGARGAVSGRPQIRRKHVRALTRAQIATFLAVFADTCNASLAAREAGRTRQVFYDLRKRDPGFRAAWAEAFRESYDLLEEELVRRARFGTPKEIFYQGRKTGTTLVFNDSVALRLLQFHRKTIEAIRAADSAPRRDGKALFDALSDRLAQIEAAKDKEGGNEHAEA